MKYLSVILATIFISGCSVGYNKSVEVTVLGEHHIFGVKKNSVINDPEGDKTVILEDSVLVSEYYLDKILEAKVNYKEK